MGVHNYLYEMTEAWDTERLDDPGDAGAIPVLQSGMCVLVSAGAETRTLAAPARAGQQLILNAKTVTTSITVTCATGFNQAGDTVALFDADGETLFLFSVYVGSNLRWRIVENPP